MTKSPMFGIGLALLGALIITPDTLLIRLSGLEGWPLTTWRGLLIGGGMLLGWMILSGRQLGGDLRQIPTMSFLVIMLENGGNTMYFNFAVVETSIIVVLPALATVPVLAVSLGTLGTGFIGFGGTTVDEMMASTLWALLVMCLLVMPLAWFMLSLVPRYTALTNVSLLMLLEMVSGPF